MVLPTELNRLNVVLIMKSAKQIPTHQQNVLTNKTLMAMRAEKRRKHCMKLNAQNKSEMKRTRQNARKAS